MNAAGSTKKEMGESEVAKCQVGVHGRGGEKNAKYFIPKSLEKCAKKCMHGSSVKKVSTYFTFDTYLTCSTSLLLVPGPS